MCFLGTWLVIKVPDGWKPVRHCKATRQAAEDVHTLTGSEQLHGILAKGMRSSRVLNMQHSLVWEVDVEGHRRGCCDHICPVLLLQTLVEHLHMQEPQEPAHKYSLFTLQRCAHLEAVVISHLSCAPAVDAEESVLRQLAGDLQARHTHTW